MSNHRPRNIAKPTKQVFKAGQIGKLKALFDKQHWEVIEDEDFSYFERYIRLLSHFCEEQQNFIMKLTERFLHLPQSEYPKFLVNSVRQLREDFPNDNLLFACCLPKTDIGKVKSGVAVLYQFKGSTIRSRVNLGKYYVVESFSPEFVSNINLDNSHFVLVDDFVGTGETALGAINYIRELFPAMEGNDRISILCIVAMQKGFDAIKEAGASVYSSVICSRGISDFYTGEELLRAKEVMQDIEQSLKKLKPEYHFGYGHSEALVCMERCPNNTFPIYWYTKNDAPYER